MTDRRKVSVCLFAADTPESVQQRLCRAVEIYCRMNGSVEAKPESRKAEELSGLCRVARTPTGKPYFPDMPHIHFSISHSGTLWACAVCESPVGLDLQEQTHLRKENAAEAAVRFRRMAHRFFHPTEAAYVDAEGMGEEETGLKESYRRFFAVWAAREAYVKYTGQGIDRHFSEHCVIPEEQELQPIPDESGAVTSWSAMGVHFRLTHLQAGKCYTLCVCTRMPAEWRFFDLRKK